MEERAWCDKFTRTPNRALDQTIKLCCEHQVMVCIYLWLKFTCEGFYKNGGPTALIILLFLSLPSDWLSIYCHTWLLWGCWWSLLKSLCLNSKKHTNGVISPACSFHLSTTNTGRANCIISGLKLVEDIQQRSEVHGKWGTGCLTRASKNLLKPTLCTPPRLSTIFHYTFIILKKTEGLGLWKHQLCLFTVFTPFFLPYLCHQEMDGSVFGWQDVLTHNAFVGKEILNSHSKQHYLSHNTQS